MRVKSFQIIGTFLKNVHNDMPIKHLNTTINTKINCQLLWQDTISLKTVDTLKLRFLEYLACGILCKVQSTFLTRSKFT